MKIEWENTKRPSIKGTAKDKEHFDRLNVLSSGRLRIVKRSQELSKESEKAVQKAVNKK